MMLTKQVKAPEPKPVTTEQKTVQFFKTVQAGDMTLFEIIDEAVAVFGFTRAGKTASCHMLCGSPLRSLEQRGEFIYQASTQKFLNAKVGLTSESETQIPNIFEGLIRDTTTKTFKKVILLDQPGYGDTYGFHRIFSNGYFHYRTFSKTPKLKFIVVIWMNDLRGTAQKFKKTIFNFIGSFVDWNAVKKNILKATAILITKSDPGMTLQNLYTTIQILRDEAISGMDQAKLTKYQEFINEMLNNKKIFNFERPTRVNQASPDSKVLQEIYDKTQFWERPRVEGQNFVDMSDINFSVFKEIIAKLKDVDDPLFKIEFEHFMVHMQERIDGMILNHQGSLRNIVLLLQQDAVGSNEQHSFLMAMHEFNLTYFDYFKSYQQKRASILNKLFITNEYEPNKSHDSEQTFQQMKSIYFIKKFKVLEHLLAVNEEVQDGGIATSRSIDELERFSNNFMQIFRKFSILRVNKTDNENIIYRYSYNVQRLIEQSKILTLILFQNEGVKMEIQKLDVKIITEDIFRLLFDRFFTLVVGQIKINPLKELFIQNLNFEELTPVNEQIITFFENMTVDNNDIEIKIAELIIEFGNQLFKNDREPTASQKKVALKRLYEYRNKFYKKWVDLKDNKGTVKAKAKAKESCVQTIINLTRNLANVIQSYHLYAQARDCYYSINDAYSIFRMYELQGEKLKSNRQQYRDLLMRQAKEASMLHRRDLAVQCCQKAYTLSHTYDQIKEISEITVNYCTENKEQQKEENDTYLKRFENDQLCEELSENLITNIEMLIAE